MCIFFLRSSAVYIHDVARWERRLPCAAINLQQYEIRLYPTLIRRVKQNSKKITSSDGDSNRLPIHHYRYFYLTSSLCAVRKCKLHHLANTLLFLFRAASSLRKKPTSMNYAYSICNIESINCVKKGIHYWRKYIKNYHI